METRTPERILIIGIAFLVGFRNKISVLPGWAWAYLVNNPEARIIVNPSCAKLATDPSKAL